MRCLSAFSFTSAVGRIERYRFDKIVCWLWAAPRIAAAARQFWFGMGLGCLVVPAGCCLYTTRLFAGEDPAFGSGQEGFQNSRVESGGARRCSKSRRSGRVGSGRVGSGDFQLSRIESGRPDPTGPVKCLLYTSAPRVNREGSHVWVGCLGGIRVPSGSRPKLYLCVRACVDDP